MGETKFFRKNIADDMRDKLSSRWGKLWDELAEASKDLAEASKDTVNDLTLLLIYLMMDLGAKPDIEDYFKLLESEEAINSANIALGIARETIAGK